MYFFSHKQEGPVKHWGKGAEYFPPLTINSLFTFRSRHYGQYGDSQQEREKELTYSTANVIQQKHCSKRGWDGCCSSETLHQEDITFQVLEMEAKSKYRYCYCKPIRNKEESYIYYLEFMSKSKNMIIPRSLFQLIKYNGLSVFWNIYLIDNLIMIMKSSYVDM